MAVSSLLRSNSRRVPRTRDAPPVFLANGYTRPEIPALAAQKPPFPARGIGPKKWKRTLVHLAKTTRRRKVGPQETEQKVPLKGPGRQLPGESEMRSWILASLLSDLPGLKLRLSNHGEARLFRLIYQSNPLTASSIHRHLDSAVKKLPDCVTAIVEQGIEKLNSFNKMERCSRLLKVVDSAGYQRPPIRKRAFRGYGSRPRINTEQMGEKVAM